jgi:putative Mg2+ transporter-C (MgtC) family protein
MSIPIASISDALMKDFVLTSDEGELLTNGVVRLLVAVLLGGVLGVEREWAGKIAGLRTHMLTALGAALFVVAPQLAGMNDEAISRILQGVVAGIGFLGGGVILKQDEQGRIKGVTTAAGLWLTTAVAICTGMGRIWLAVLCTALALVILGAVRRLEVWINPEAHDDHAATGKKQPRRS